MTGSLPLHKVRCAFCRYWQPTLPRDSADWGYCEIWEVLESPQVARSAPGPTLILTDPSQLDRKMVTNESFGCNHIRRIDE